jgi:hypothetical protein
MSQRDRGVEVDQRSARSAFDVRDHDLDRRTCVGGPFQKAECIRRPFDHLDARTAVPECVGDVRDPLRT